MIFDGKAFAREIEATIRHRLRSGVRVPKIVSILVGDYPSSATLEWRGDPAHSTSSGQASVLYTRLKSKAAERVGIEFDVVKQTNILTNQLRNLIAEIGEREDVTGIMVQLPVPLLQGQALKGVLSAIPLEKDVDGLRWEESGVKPATVRAILTICESIANNQYPIINNQIKSNHQKINNFWKSKFVVLGARGAVGRPLVHFLKERGVEVSEIEWDTPEPFDLVAQGEVVISCVGKPGVVTGEMVQPGVVAINVGMKEINGEMVGDMAEEVYQKASIAVPVRGGVGPVTIACLLQNALEIYR